MRSLRETERAKKKAYNRAYRQKHKAQLDRYNHRYYKKNKDRLDKYNHRYYRKNRERLLVLQRERNLRYTRALNERIFARYGTKCACCGESRREFLTIEHKNNDGGKERKRLKGGQMIKVRLLRGPKRKDIEILCFNCNCSKGFRGYCPHERERATGYPPSLPTSPGWPIPF